MPYHNFAEFYDGLTTNVDYHSIALNLQQIINTNKDKCELVLDLACGTGSLACELAKLGYEVIGVDSSAEMLMEAYAKNEGLDKPVMYLCQSMEQLDLYGTIDVAVCTLDSINHITKEASLQRAFNRVSLFLEPKGLFIFDCNTAYKHEIILGDNAYIYENEEVYCIWQNTLGKDKRTVEIKLDFFIPEPEGGLYSRTSESFFEKSYSQDQLTDMLKKAGLQVISIKDEDGGPPRTDSQRLQFIAIKE